jgi:hypothetical protein
LLAQAGRLIGSPLPLSRACGTPALVSVTEDPVSGGQYWMRIYGRPRGRPQVIGSCKAFSGPTGLEEYVGGGFGIALRVMVEDAGFTSSLSIISGAACACGCSPQGAVKSKRWSMIVAEDVVF